MERDAAHIPYVDSGSYPIRAGNLVRPLVDGEAAFRRICEAVEGARSSVWLTVAFLARDFEMPDGRGSLFDVLDRAQQRGIDVRALFWRSPEQEKQTAGVHFSGTEEERAALGQRDSRFLARWDYLPEELCHHQKSWLIDAGQPDELAFVGGINLNNSSVASTDHPPRACGNTHDVYVELAGPAATDVHHNFVQRWNEASERDKPDGVWPADSGPAELDFPERLSTVAGDVPVQLSRTVLEGRYRNGSPPPGGRPFEIHAGEKSILDQYQRAIEAARSTIYVEDQAIGSPGVVGGLIAALERDVQVVFLVPANAHDAFVRARRNPKLKPFFELLSRLKAFPDFTLAGISSHEGPGRYHDIYVHAKIALIDDGWATIGSTNIAERSFHGDTELNASFWHEPTVRSLRCELLREHLGVDTTHLDDRRAFALYREIAQKNAVQRASGKPLDGLAFEIDPDEYGL